ncbi:unnamed protein product [Miscanthus lutarioriparius]|uniref:Major facilitator superfamily (MFS) profile domain-containing protein n=1 Tax=Miscanthus lutarioriparius TaxID=422564 RepID=A0A811R0Y9_9POAL|nr:unnamed protein product [Miscanthus lutarioriparius]
MPLEKLQALSRVFSILRQTWGGSEDPADYRNDRNWIVHRRLWSRLLVRCTQLLLLSGHADDFWSVSVIWMAFSGCSSWQLVWEEQEGLIMGIWNAHTSVGNISGSLIAAAMLKYGWCWSFAVPGIMIALVGLTVFLFLPVGPDVIGIQEDLHLKDYEKSDMDTPLLERRSSDVKEKAVGFIEAWRIPGVAPFALCLFFCKLVAYTFLYWLPFYISHTAIGGQYLSDSEAGVLSTLFDVGGVVGGILAGHISDHLDARALTAASFTFSAIPALFFYRIYGNVSLAWNIALMFVTGMLVNGPYALITTAVSADLGTHSSLNGNSRALATVTAIIDGTGSIGAAIGPLLTGYISARSWSAVFTMLMASALVAGAAAVEAGGGGSGRQDGVPEDARPCC